MISMRSFVDEMEKIADDGLLGEFTGTGMKTGVSPTANTRPSPGDRTAPGRRGASTPAPAPGNPTVLGTAPGREPRNTTTPAPGGATGTGTAPNNTAHTRMPEPSAAEKASWEAHRQKRMAGYEHRRFVVPENAPAPQPAPQVAPQPAHQPAPHTAPHAIPHAAPSAAAAEQAVSHAPGLFSRMAAGARKVAPGIAAAAAHSPLAFAAGTGLAGIGGTAGASALRRRRRDRAQQG